MCATQAGQLALAIASFDSDGTTTQADVAAPDGRVDGTSNWPASNESRLGQPSSPFMNRLDQPADKRGLESAAGTLQDTVGVESGVLIAALKVGYMLTHPHLGSLRVVTSKCLQNFAMGVDHPLMGF